MINSKTVFLLSILLFIFACNISKQSTQKKQNIQTQKQLEFEGKITYDLIIKDKTGEMTKEQVRMFMGNEQIYTIKKDKYKSEMNGMMKMTQIYLGQDTLYTQMVGTEKLLCTDVTKNSDEILDYNIQNKVATIAGIECDLLTIKSKEGTTKYYFNKEFYVNPINFKSHKYGFWSFFVEQTNTIPIKSISDTNELYFEVSAKNIHVMEINDSEFNLPNLPRADSPFD